MRVLVTGATGGAGSWIVDRLADAGHDVTGVDQRPPDGHREGVTFYAADLADPGEAAETVVETDPDAVVHFAAIPNPLGDPGTTVFTNNVESTYNVLVAAGRQGARVVWASSESIYGTAFAEEPWLPDYLPLDEAHEVRPEDPYGTSKPVGEDVADMVARKYGISVTSIRPAWIQYPGRYVVEDQRTSFDPETAEPSGNFWSYVDVRDVADAVAAALAADVTGHEAVHVMAAENYVGRPTRELFEATFGECPGPCDLDGEQCAFSLARAREVLDWAPEHTWREARDEAVPGPDLTAG
jgi:nucleoside-diphosphate-sugar epimerase